jgi:hypothetical protein
MMNDGATKGALDIQRIPEVNRSKASDDKRFTSRGDESGLGSPF